MNARELNVGNIVNYKHIPVIFSLDDFVEASFNSEFLSILISPIPLNNKWFKYFGFSTFSSEGVKYYKKNSFVISFCNGRYVKYNHNGVNIKLKYVHQLQNLYFVFKQKDLTTTCKLFPE